jgi:hypothetical protein
MPTSAAIMLWVMSIRRIRFWWIRWLWMLFVRIPIVILVSGVIAEIVPAGLNRGTVQPRIATVKFGLSLVTQLAQRKLLLRFQFAADIGIFAIRLAALG